MYTVYCNIAMNGNPSKSQRMLVLVNIALIFNFCIQELNRYPCYCSMWAPVLSGLWQAMYVVLQYRYLLRVAKYMRRYPGYIYCNIMILNLTWYLSVPEYTRTLGSRHMRTKHNTGDAIGYMYVSYSSTYTWTLVLVPVTHG